MFKNVLIPTDGSELSAEALRKGLAFAKALGARATVMTAIEPFHVLTVDAAQLESTRSEYEKLARVHAAKVLETATADAGAAGVTIEVVQAQGDYPYEEIIRVAEAKGCDVIAMASHGRRGMAALMIGSQTQKVLTHSKIPVLVFR